MSFNPYQFQIDDLKRRLEENRLLLNDPELAELAQLESSELTQQLAEMEKAAAEFESSTDSGSDATGEQITNCVIELRQGTGGDEAKIWGNDLLRMYIRFVEQLGLTFEYLDDEVIKVKGKVTNPELIAQLTGPSQREDAPQPATSQDLPTLLYPYDIFKYESGVHRVQRVPATEAQGRIHTSTASVAVIPEVKKTAVEINEADLSWEFMRAGGAGGQNVNKVNSAVRLTHIPTGIVVTSRRERKQDQNREIALDIMRGQLWEVQEEARLKELGKARSAIGRNMRAEKIRTFNYPQNRVTDHRINQSWYSLDTIIEGNLTDIIREVRAGLTAELTPEISSDTQPNSPAIDNAL
jgi:peptide chain release factor 1